MDSQELLDLVIALRGELKEIKSSISVNAIKLDKAEVKEKLLHEQYEAARKERIDLKHSADSLRVKSIKANDKLLELNRLLRIAMAEEARANALKVKAERFDLITIGAPWRELAMSHQISGAKFLAASEKSICGDVRGLGKTATVIAACDMVEAQKICYISPNDVTHNVVREFARWAPHRKAVYNISGMDRTTREVMLPLYRSLALTNFVIIVNYEALRDPSTVQMLKDMRFDTVIADEAHVMKETDTIAFNSVNDLCWDINVCPSCIESSEFRYVDMKKQEMFCAKCVAHIKLSAIDDVSRYRSIKHIWPMTGTPILNKPQELYALLALVAPELFPSKTAFLADYCEKTYGKWHFREGGAEALLEKISGFFLRRDTASAGVELPPMEEISYDLEFDKVKYAEQWEAYKQLQESAYIRMENNQSMTTISAITEILRLRQMIVYPQGIEMRDPDTGLVIARCAVTQSIKLDWTIDKITEILDEDPDTHIVVFSQFKSPLRRLSELLGPKSVVLDGGTPTSVRTKIAEHFDANGKIHNPEWRVILANYKVGGVGLNFTRANFEIDLDEEWNPGKIDQAHGRINRMGQLKRTFVLVPRVKGTVDIWMNRQNKRKADMQAGFVEGAESLAAQFMEAMDNGFA